MSLANENAEEVAEVSALPAVSDSEILVETSEAAALEVVAESSEVEASEVVAESSEAAASWGLSTPYSPALGAP